MIATDTSDGRPRGRARERRAARARRAGRASSAGTVPPGRRFDLVVANLPYVREGEWAALEPEITEYEPREALVAGADGLEAIAAVAAARERRTRSTPGARWRSRSARARPAAVAELLRRARLRRRSRRRRTWPGSTASCSVAWRPDGRLDRARWRAEAAGGARALHRGAAGWRSSRPTASTGSPATRSTRRAIERIHALKGRDDGKPSAVMYFSPLAMRELLDGARPAHPRGARRAAAGPGDAGRRQPRAPLPARLPRGPGAPRRAADRRPARRSDRARSSRPAPIAAASRRRAASRTSTAAILARRRPGDRRRRAGRARRRRWSTSPRSMTGARGRCCARGP